MIFTLSPLELERYHKFMKHKCSKKWLDPYTSKKYTPTPKFIFEPTGMGDGLTLLCVCGKEKNITDYESW